MASRELLLSYFVFQVSFTDVSMYAIFFLQLQLQPIRPVLPSSVSLTHVHILLSPVRP